MSKQRREWRGVRKQRRKRWKLLKREQSEQAEEGVERDEEAEEEAVEVAAEGVERDEEAAEEAVAAVNQEAQQEEQRFEVEDECQERREEDDISIVLDSNPSDVDDAPPYLYPGLVPEETDSDAEIPIVPDLTDSMFWKWEE